jgi:penicillin-binding protein 2
MPLRFSRQCPPYLIQHQRIKVLIAMVFLFSLILILRLLDLQWFEYNKFQTLSLKNQMSVTPTPPPRGIIVDRNGVVLADNMPIYVLEIIPELVKNLESTLQRLHRLIPSITQEDIQLFQRLRQQNRKFVPTPLKMKLTQEEIATFAVNQYHFPGVRIKAESLRYYPLGEETAHLLGYVGRINLEELKNLDPQTYQGAQFIGKTGVERYYESRLHGVNGYEQVETDVSGRIVRVINKLPPKSGEILKLTLDTRLQHVAYEALGENYGAVVLIETATGAILAMASRPSFDPNHFVGGISPKEYHQLSNAAERPLFNRAVRGLYPPASTIKPYIALTGLNVGVIDKHTAIYDPGWYKLPNVSHVYHDWNKRGHGMVNLLRAVTVSCDPYFYHLGHLLGITPIHHMLSEFGFGSFTQIDLLEESAGIVPDASWKKRTKGVSWYPGDSLITAIGQGFMLVSPLQMAVAAATLAEKGHRYQPHLLYSSSKNQFTETLFKPIQKKVISLQDPEDWDLIHEAMHSVTTSPEGTGYRFGRNPPYPVAAKTGTAQVFGGKEYARRLHQVLPKHLRDHSLFIAFSPVETPRVAIAVIVEHDVLASMVARQVLNAYYKLYPLETTT